MSSGIHLAAMGSYTVGGSAIEVSGQPVSAVAYSDGYTAPHDPNGHYWSGQAYVQYFVPAALRFPEPVLFVHGGGLTGSSWETTPDGRSGFAQRFLEAGIAVHVLDNVERGRAGFPALPSQWPGDPVVRSDEEAWDLYRFGARDQFASRIPFPGQQFPIEHIDELARKTVPRWSSTRPAQLDAVEQVARRIGRCILIGHSQGGGLVIEAAFRIGQRAAPASVAAVVAIEPHGAYDDTNQADLNGMPLALVFGDFIDQSNTWLELRKKALQAGEIWGRRGGRAELIDLPAYGLIGNSHMPMMDLNSDDVAHLLINWLDRKLLTAMLDAEPARIF